MNCSAKFGVIFLSRSIANIACKMKQSKIHQPKYWKFCGRNLAKILKKIAEWPKCIETASSRLEPHRIPIYLYELSSEFHSYWNMGREDKSKRFINDDKKIPNDKLVFLKIISNVSQLVAWNKNPNPPSAGRLSLISSGEICRLSSNSKDFFYMQ